MSDHSHYGEYAEARHHHEGDYAPDRHDHDLDYADKHHDHYDLQREDERLKALIDQWGRDLRALREDLASALGRIRLLEQQTPQARQLQLEADQAAADLAASGFGDDYDPELDDESWRSTLTDYAVASGAAEYDDQDDDEAAGQPFAAVPRLRRVTCTRTVVTDGNPEPCGLPVDHDPDEKCPGNPHARPAPEASLPDDPFGASAFRGHAPGCGCPDCVGAISDADDERDDQ